MKPQAKKRGIWQSVAKAGWLLSLLISCSTMAWAQLRIVGAISGTVQDQTGAVVASAKVILKDAKTGITRETSSTSGGTFLFPDLASGSYEIIVTAAGFKMAKLPNVAVS